MPSDKENVVRQQAKMLLEEKVEEEPARHQEIGTLPVAWGRGVSHKAHKRIGVSSL